MKYKYFFVFLSLISMSAHAAIFYRHIPFTMALEKNDTLVVDYDFSEKKGIDCASTYKNTFVDFVYKGHQKASHLPTHLESDHIPNKEGEELADLHGQFTLSAHQEQPLKPYEISCHYAEG